MESTDKKYYSQRKSASSATISLDLLRQIFGDYYTELVRKGYLDEWLGEPDGWGDRRGGLTDSPEAYVLRKLRKNLWPIDSKVPEYSEDDLLSMIEFLHDHVSKPDPLTGNAYSARQAQIEYRNELNPVLHDFSAGLVLNELGEIRTIELGGMDYLLSANIPQPTTISKDIIATIERCIDKFRTRGSTLDDRKAVITELAGVFEEMQKNELLSQVLNDKDEAAIFEFANRFAIRHRNPDQIRNYDKDIWLSWVFYYYLATIHAVLRLIARQEAASNPSEDLWLQVLEELKRQDTTLYGIMRLAKPSLAKGTLTLTFNFQFHLRRAQLPSNVALLKKTLASVAGRDIDIKFQKHVESTASGH